MRILLCFDGSQAGLGNLRVACADLLKNQVDKVAVLVSMFVTSANEPVQLEFYEDNTFANEQLLDFAIALVQSYGFQNVSGELACLSYTTDLVANLAKQAQAWQATVIYVPNPHLGRLFSIQDVQKRNLWQAFLHNFARFSSPPTLKKPLINPLISLALLEVDELLQLTKTQVVLTAPSGVEMRLTCQKATQSLSVTKAALESSVLNADALVGGGEWTEIPIVKQTRH
jgi:hypothetical protein